MKTNNELLTTSEMLVKLEEGDWAGARNIHYPHMRFWEHNDRLVHTLEGSSHFEYADLSKFIFDGDKRFVHWVDEETESFIPKDCEGCRYRIVKTNDNGTIDILCKKHPSLFIPIADIDEGELPFSCSQKEEA